MSDKSRNLPWNSDVVSGYTGITPRLISVKSVVPLSPVVVH